MVELLSLYMRGGGVLGMTLNCNQRESSLPAWGTGGGDGRCSLEHVGLFKNCGKLGV
jgi:hypothetical protein